MGGGATTPNGISYTEINAWAELTGNLPTLFEIQALREMDNGWRMAYDQGQGKKGSKGVKETAQHQGLGDYCNGEHLEACKKNFGNGLERACATCPD